MNRKLIINIIILIIVVLLVRQALIYLPFLMSGPPFELYSIKNKDNIDHKVNIQVFDPSGKLVINNTYEIKSRAYVVYPESKWKDNFEKDKLFPKGQYAFKITIDDDISKASTQYVDTWRQTFVEINRIGEDKKEIEVTFSTAVA